MPEDGPRPQPPGYTPAHHGSGPHPFVDPAIPGSAYGDPNFGGVDPNQFRSAAEYQAAVQQLNAHLADGSRQLQEHQAWEASSDSASSQPPVQTPVSPQIKAAEMAAWEDQRRKAAEDKAKYCSQPELHAYNSSGRGGYIARYTLPAIIVGAVAFVWGGVALGLPQYNFDMMWNGGGNVLIWFCAALSAGIVFLFARTSERRDNRKHFEHIKTCRKKLSKRS